jgi:hypothetical protein
MSPTASSPTEAFPSANLTYRSRQQFHSFNTRPASIGFRKNLHAQAGYTRLNRPAETDMQRYFQLSPPSVHQMVLTLEREGFIRRQPGVRPQYRNAR